ncbi:hypothetical protein [Ktedonospora formicarum]|nr:hypothetical protein [Ktedonospora formicarum]
MRTKDSRAVLRGLGRSNAPRLPGALRKKTDAFYNEHQHLYYKNLSAMRPLLKQQKEHAWLAEASSVPLQQALRHLDQAFLNFFEGRAKHPAFKKKRHHQSATYTANAFTWRNGCLTLARDG